MSAVLDTPVVRQAAKADMKALPETVRGIVPASADVLTNAAYDAATDQMDMIRGIINLLIVYNGETDKSMRLKDAEVFGLYAFMAARARDISTLTWEVSNSIATACFNVRAILETLENVLQNNDLENQLGTETNDGLVRAVLLGLDELDAELKEARQ